MKPYDRLLEHNIKPSMQRIAIMEYLMEHPIHPSADDIYTALSPSMPTLSKTTVYNTLKLFSEQGAALMLTIDEKNTNFDADTSVHSHFLCKRCMEGLILCSNNRSYGFIIFLSFQSCIHYNYKSNAKIRSLYFISK